MATTASGVRLGLAVSPTDASPISALSRPTPPTRIRSKRMSNPQTSSASTSTTTTPTPRSRMQNEIDHQLRKERGHTSSTSSGRQSLERYTGIVEDRTEDELHRASRQALQDALRREWTDREKLLARLEELDTVSTTHQDRNQELVKANEALLAKYDTAFNEQSALEAELEAANDRVDRLRNQIADAERLTRQGHRRYADQEKAFEAERLVHHAELQHLHQRIKSLSTERVARTGNGEPHAALQEELMTLTVSHQTLVAQLTTLADELHEVKADNGRLQEENDSWQLLIEERTLAGTMRGGLLGLPDEASTPYLSSIRRKEPNALETLEEQMEMDELHADLDMQQPIFDESDRVLSQQLNRGQFADRSSPPPMNGSLAMELSAVPQSVEVESLRNEMKSLKEANRALSLYCSKILDRIIAQEGYEHVLSVDYRTRRGTSRQVSGSKRRPSVEELAQSMEEHGPPPMPILRPRPVNIPAPVDLPVNPPPKETKAKAKARPQSMIVQSTPVPVATPDADDKVLELAPPKKEAEKKSRRTFSIDFRSLGFGAPEKVESKPQLKPLQLASRAVSASSVPVVPAAAAATNSNAGTSPPKTTSTPSPVLSVARKLEPQEEDDEDRRERHRMEATLKLMGIASIPTPDGTQHTESPWDKVSPLPAVDPVPAAASTTTPTTSTGAVGWLTRRLSRATAPTVPVPTPVTTAVPPETAGATPLARLSMTLGGTDPILQGLVDLSDQPSEDHEATAAALRAYDAREREQARLIAEGKSMAMYTSPPKISTRRAGRRSSSQSFSSGTGSSAPSTAYSAGPHGEVIAPAPSEHHKARASISTLWSIGSSRASVDLDHN